MAIDWHCAEPWLSANQLRILAAFHAGDTSLYQVRGRFKRSQAWASSNVRPLERFGLIEAVGAKNAGWRLLQDSWGEALGVIKDKLLMQMDNAIASLEAAATETPKLPPRGGGGVERRGLEDGMREMLLERRNGAQ